MFERVIGQQLPKEILSTAIGSGKLSHAYIFYGQSGVGKTTLAIEFAKSIVCRNHSACGTCDACQQFFSTSDVKIIRPQKSISVSDIREITSEIYLKPFLFDKKIYVITDADKMTVQAQNALLKVFEEPPSYAVIVLVTSNLSMILPTILSRGVQIRFSPLSLAELKLCFQNEGKPIPEDGLLSRANGSATRAFALAESEGYRSMRETLISDIRLLFQKRTTKEVIRLYSDFLTYQEEWEALWDIFNSLVYDSTVSDPSLCKNTDIRWEVSLPVGTAENIYKELRSLKQKLSANGAYNIGVLTALTSIRNHLNKERIS
ncbi:MAG: DNA polymerase III subunit [Clostridia bacterium]|nr:DNA polymerase III subunit [Clostridia bacterium]